MWRHRKSFRGLSARRIEGLAAVAFLGPRKKGVAGLALGEQSSRCGAVRAEWVIVLFSREGERCLF